MNKVLINFYLIIAFFIYNTSHAQITEKYFGTALQSEMILDAIFTNSNQKIHVGYVYTPPVTNNTDCLVFKTDSSNNLLWSFTIATPNIDKLHSVIETSDGNYVAVGIINSLSIYNNNTAFVVKFSAAGNILWEKQFKNTAAGEILYDIKEMPSNQHLICTGSYNFTPGLVDAMLIDLEPVNGNIVWAKYYAVTGSNQFFSSAIINNKIYSIGFYQGISFYDGYIACIDENTGNIIWSNSYNFNSALVVGNACNWFLKSFAVGDKIYIDNNISNDYNNTTSQTNAILEVDTLGQNPVCLEIKKTNNNYSNESNVLRYQNSFYVINHPANVTYSVLYGNGMGSAAEATLTKLNSLNASPGSISFCKKIGNPGDQGIYSLKVKNNKFYATGLSINDPGQIGNIDAFSIESDTFFNSNNNCIMFDTTLQLANLNVAVTNYNFTNVANATFNNPPIITVKTNFVQNAITICFDTLINTSVTANFSYINISNCGSATYNFTDLSTTLNSNIISWNWDFGDGNTSTQQNPTHFYAASGTYNVKLKVTNNLNQSDSITQVLNVTVYTLPNVFANASTNAVCLGNPVTLNANGSAISYAWTGGVTNGIPFIPSNTNTYTVTGTDANGCTATSSVTVTVNAGLNVSIVPNQPILCAGDSIMLTATGALNYVWNATPGLTNYNTATTWAYPSVNTTYIVTGSDANGCTGTASVTINVVNEITVLATKNRDVECGVNTIQLQGQGADTYTWSPAAGLSNPNAAWTNATITETTTFYLTGSTGSCVGTDSITVYVYNNDEGSIFIPNAFSPNGDGNNDCLRIKHKAKFEKYFFTIYNRWGQKLFETDDPNACWDGNFNGKVQGLETYFYYLKAKTSCGDIFKKGDLIMVK